MAPDQGLPMNRLKTRPDFLRAQKGIRRVTTSLTLEACASPDSPDGPRVGFTATRKLGNAVARNRAKRRLREAARAVLPLSGRSACDYVLVARPGTLSRPFPSLVEDLAAAVRAAHLKMDQHAAGEPS